MRALGFASLSRHSSTENASILVRLIARAKIALCRLSSAKGVSTRYHLCSQQPHSRCLSDLKRRNCRSKPYPITGMTRENLLRLHSVCPLSTRSAFGSPARKRPSALFPLSYFQHPDTFPASITCIPHPEAALSFKGQRVLLFVTAFLFIGNITLSARFVKKFVWNPIWPGKKVIIWHFLSSQFCYTLSAHNITNREE